MIKKPFHNSILNLIKTLFKAPKGDKLVFFGGQFSYAFLFVTFFLVATFSFIQSVESKRANVITFGTSQTVNIFPSVADSSDWSGLNSTLIQELTDNSFYQQFDAKNSAYITQEVLVIPNVESVPNATAESGEVVEVIKEDESVITETDEPAQVTESVPEDKVEPEPSPEPVVAPESKPELEPLSFVLPEFTIFNSSVKLYPLLQFSSNTSTTPLPEDVISEPELPAEVELKPVVTTGDYVASSSPALPDLDTSIASTSVPQDLDLVSILEEVVIETTELSVHEISLGNFDTAALQRGQIINGMQLRLSMGAKLKKVATSNIPRVEILFGKENSMSVIGSIQLEDEISNAINGGYFLFALPELRNIKELDKAKVVVRYYGEIEDLEGMFLDSVWLELDTKIITKEDLRARSLPENFADLKSPEFSTLLSEKINFRREERPSFNLRYNSQRNFIVRGFRNLFDKDLAEVESTMLKHKSEGFINVSPTITSTQSGLLTIEFSESDRKKLRPGMYEIEMVINEGGKRYVDTFNFEWGILTTNPNKSEYQAGESAFVSIGALTPSGHTVCEANLDLYVIAPDETVERLEVLESGVCDGNNIIDVPDFTSQASTTMLGAYELYLERLDDDGNLMSYTSDTFNVVDVQDISIERNGPTRIFPPAPYPMSLTIKATETFVGTLTERVPASFAVSSTTANIVQDGEWQILTWDMSVRAGESKTVSYGFDAPDLSPYLFNLGPARLDSSKTTKENVTDVATDVASSTDVLSSATSTTPAKNADISFIEHRQWQIASDAVGNMILFWDDGASIPAGWTCLSCGSGTFFQKFVMGSSTYNTTGGVATHTHTAVGSVFATADNITESGSGTVAPAGHTHSYTPTIAAASNLPQYRQLRVIQYTAAAGEPALIPAGAIGIFDVASSSLPVNWNRYAAQDGNYVYGENTPGTTGGSNTHTHAISGTTGAAGGSGTRSRGGTSNGSTQTHTHTVTGATAANSNEPPYVEVLLARLTTATAPPNGLIAMWTDDVDGGWINVSANPGDPFNQRFIKPVVSYGATGGSDFHAPASVIGLLTSAPSAVANAVSGGSSGSSNTHTHAVDVTGFSSSNNLPPYLTAVFGKRQGTDPVYDQFSSLWYVNNNAQTPTDPWPAGATDLTERVPITALTTPVKDGDVVRLRMNLNVTNATSSVGSSFKLQFTATSTCSAATTWLDVGDTASSSVWRGYDNATPVDGSVISTNRLGSTTVSENYIENGQATSSANEIGVDAYGEWDFVLQQNGAEAGTNYCFRMVEGDGTELLSYSHYPQLYTNEAPTSPVLSKLFDNEKVASTSPWFEFSAADVEGQKVHYEIEIDNNYDFSSTILDRDTISNSGEFENQALISDKAPFIQGNLIRFIPSTPLTNGTTYYWRVRGQDPDGSGQWGEWSVIKSFTIDTSLVASGWFQTEDEQFGTNTLSGVQTGSDQVVLISGSTTGSMRSSPIDFNDGDLGTAWGSLQFSDTETVGDIKYQVQYLDGTDTWVNIPDVDLASNSSGFDASPVSLLGLDTDTYTMIRIVSNFTNSGGSPSLQDWTVNWGYRVETPTITKLFPNEQVGTTTPIFEFSTTDPQSDSLTYQVEWSETPDFAVSTVRTSDSAAGFENIDVGVDTDPFFSGDTIQFTLQPADVLTGTTTYWWRVRAKDTTGSNSYSFWTEPQSFTVIPATEVSTWFQTTQEQFESNILSGTIGLPTDVVSVATTATEAIVVYGEGTVTTPRYRQWNGSAWSTEGSLLDIAAPTKWVVTKAGTTREEYIAATVGTDADVNVQVFSTGAWGNLLEATVSMGNVNARGFDVAYETISGDALVVYCDGDADPSFYVWNGSSWTSGGTINLASTNNCEWIKLASDPVSDEIVLMARDSDGTAAASYESQVWNGSTWGNSITQGGARSALYETMALNYEDSGGQLLSISGDGNPARFEYNSWNGAAWAGLTTNATIADNLIWTQLARDAGTDNMTMCYVDESVNIGVIRWTGSAWAGQTNLSTIGNAVSDKAVSCTYETTAGRDGYSMVVYSDTNNAQYRFWNGATWSAEASVSTITDSATVHTVRTGVGTILGFFFDDVNDLVDFSSWNGSSWSTAQTLETNASVDSAPYGQPFMAAPRNPGTEGSTVVSPGVDFNSGVGPYWDEFSWNDTQPGTSDILYYLQYETAPDTWALIPNAALSGNESGFNSGPIDLSGLNTATYNVIRPYAELTCDGSGNCPSISDWKIEWAGGITISGTVQQYDQSSNVTSGTVGVAVNGVLQTGKTGTISAGAWSISNVTAFAGDIITIFISGANDPNEAVAVARYDGAGDMDGVVLYERHLSLGSNTATTTPFTNADIGLYDFTNTEDIFTNVTGTTLSICATTGCADAELYIKAGAYYAPGGKLITHDFENNGIFVAGAFTHEINGSWDNNATTTMTGSTIVFAATSTTESIDNTGAISPSFNGLTFGTTTGNATWNLVNTIDVNGNLSVTRGTLARGSLPITIAGNLITGANGFWSGIGTTTFDGAAAATWEDQNATLQNIGRVVVDGTSKIVTLAGNVAAESITIGANDTLDASTSNFDITVYKGWSNQNNFVARSGEVFFAATTSPQFITTTGDAFYDLSFTGTGGSWSFTEPTLLVNNNLIASSGSVTLPTGTTTIAGSFDATNGSFGNNNGTLYFTSASPETITFDGGSFTNVASNMTFNGAGSWTITDTSATSTGDVRVTQGTLNFPAGVQAIGGTLIDNGGVFVGGSGTVLFYSTDPEVITIGGSNLNNVEFNSIGSWSFSDTNVSILGNLLVAQGALTLPSGTLSIGGSYLNSDTVIAGTGSVAFNSTDTGETVNFGTSPLYDVTFSSPTGGWTLAASATTTNNFTLASVSDWTLSSGEILSVAGVFSNSSGASTTWTGSTLSLEGGDYSINTKTDPGDTYEILRLNNTARIATWNSDAVGYQVNGTASLYSQDHAGADGDLHIFGTYAKNAGNEYWSYATDFDGTDLSGGSERQADVRFASGASATFSNVVFEALGDIAASTTVSNQGSGSYIVDINAGTTTAQYYEFSDLGSTGVSYLSGAIVSVLRDGSYIVAANSGSAITLSSTTIDANPGKQIYNVTFATTTAITGTNVAQTDGTPASYWWFREGSGNLYGENYDNDTGDPGSVRFDDSSLILTISGTIYGDAGVTPIAGGTCDDSAQVVRVVVNGGASYTGSCSSTDGSYSIGGVIAIGDPTLTVYLDNAPGGEKGSTITRTPTSNVTNMDIYANRVIVRNEDVEALTIANLAAYDSTDDIDLQFTAATSTGNDTLAVSAGNELFVFATSTFTPGGTVTLNGNAAANSYDGTLYINNGATFNAYSSSTLTVGGRLVLASAATFDAASTTVVMNATTSGKSITSLGEVTFNDLVFNGVGGSWNLGADIRVLGDMTITNGTVTGTSDITLPNGSLTGDGILSLGAGTTTLASTNTLGGGTAWTFYNLQLGDAVFVGTTTPVFTATTTISGRLTISAAHYFDAGATNWDLAGTGTVFVENGTFVQDTSTIRYSGAGANVLGTQYYNLDINSGAGSQTYSATGVGLIVDNSLSIGGDATSIFDVNTNDTALDINGDVTILSNGTLSASDSGQFTISGSYANDGTFAANGGTVVFDGTGVTNITAGASSFSTVRINSTGDVTVTEHATSSVFIILAATTFTLDSGQSLETTGTFYNALGGAATTWTGSTLRLSGNGNYSINAATTTDSYATLDIDGTTQIRMWNSDAGTYDVAATASLYSQDHANIAGDLYVYGDYKKTSGTDYWSYATDFDGTTLGGSSRKVEVYLASGASVYVTGGGLAVTGIDTASTTIQNQGAGTYSFVVGQNASSSFSHYEVRDIDSNGLTFTGNANVNGFSNGDLEVSQNGGTAVTIGGTVITANPAKNFNLVRFALNGVGSGFNVTATGTTVSSWRFANHYGDIDGEGFDTDPDGDPGYIAWDDSAALITVSGTVYSDEGSTASTFCDGSTNNITLEVAGITAANTSCGSGTGTYTFTNVSYGSSDSLIVYIDGETEKGATVTKEPVSNITNLDIYENRVIVRHENVNPINISDMAIWDSSDDADIPFTAVVGSPDTLTLPADRKLIVWNGKEFAPDGNVVVTAGGSEAYGGSIQLYNGAVWTGSGSESITIGGNFVLDTAADFTASNGTTTFTTSGAGRTIDVNESPFNNVAFTGSGSWTMTDATATFGGNVTKSAGALTLPAGTSTFSGSFINTGGTFSANGGYVLFNGTGSHTVTLGGSDLATTEFAGGTHVFGDTNATTTGSTTISSGSLTLPSGVLAVGGDFENTGGTITHNTSEIKLTNATAANLEALGSDLYTVTFGGGGAYTMVDDDFSFLGSLSLLNGSLSLASGTIAIGGSFDASGGTFTHPNCLNSTSTIIFNSSDGGEYIDPGTSDFCNVRIAAPSGGYTLVANATTTKNFDIASANNFTVQSGTTLQVEGVFFNTVGGTNTIWSGSTLSLNGANEYTINTKASGADQYETLLVGANSDIRMWSSAATTTSVDVTSSLYSQDNAAVDGYLYIYGDFHISTTTEYWSYATDFDGTSLSGSERAVTVAHATSAVTSLDGGSLRIIGVSGNETYVSNQVSGTYSFNVSDGTFLAQYYAFRDLDAAGLNFSGTPTISSLSYGDYELAVDGGTLISLSSTTLNANASLVITGNRFATTTAITGSNITLSGTTPSAWTFTSHTGNLDGENYDVDGITACGSIRWSDSSCLLTQQTNYRWRNDDGGLGVPATEWYDVNWDARKRVRLQNADAATYADAVVRLDVAYDSDMQSDFDDLRFTSDDGTTLLSHWIGSTTNSVSAEVWVEVPSLASLDTTSVYMYYNNPSATSVSSATSTFIAADDFDDGNISEYSGETVDFTVDGTFDYSGANALDATSNETGRTESGGMYRLDLPVAVGQTIRYMQYIDPSQSDEVCTKFGVQTSGAPSNNYAVCTDYNGTDRLVLVRDGVDNADTAPAVTLDSYNIASTTGWHEIEIEWAASSIQVSMYGPTGSLLGVASSTDSTYSSGGFGFSFWYQSGGWDNFTSRPTLATEPAILFGDEQIDGGATWLAAQNTTGVYNVNDIARLRVVIENTGIAITNQQFLLEYASQGIAPSCEAVNPVNYAPVPVQASCGSSPVCMQSSAFVSNGASTFDLLAVDDNAYNAGEAREDPSNSTGNLNIGQDAYTELEYVVTPTSNVADENICFRVTNNGSDYDTYLSVAKMQLRFDPIVASLNLNDGLPISLLPGTTSRVYATGTVTDLNGYADIVQATSTFYRSGVAGGAACTSDNNNCYVASGPQCSFTNCAGNTCDVECYVDMYFHTDPTDTGSVYEGQEWFAFVEAEDTGGGYGGGSSIGQELSTLRAIDVVGQIDYGALAVNTDTGAINASTSVENQGNVEIDVEVLGTDLSDGVNSSIPASQQKFATTTFTYSACGVTCALLSSTTPVSLDVDLGKPSTDTPPVSDDVYWGIALPPAGISSTPHQGINVFTPISP